MHKNNILPGSDPTITISEMPASSLTQIQAPVKNVVWCKISISKFGILHFCFTLSGGECSFFGARP